jgi:hypothetical protein
MIAVEMIEHVCDCGKPVSFKYKADTMAMLGVCQCGLEWIATVTPLSYMVNKYQLPALGVSVDEKIEMVEKVG